MNNDSTRKNQPNPALSGTDLSRRGCKTLRLKVLFVGISRNEERGVSWEEEPGLLAKVRGRGSGRRSAPSDARRWAAIWWTQWHLQFVDCRAFSGF